MREFVPGRHLARDFYRDAVRPLLGDTEHSAAHVGSGSDVLGFDTERSTDHGWGPRCHVFVAEHDVARIDELLDGRLPAEYRGWPVRYGWDARPVTKHVEVTTVNAWLDDQFGCDPRAGLTYRDWLAAPQQVLLEMTAGDVFHDGLGELEPARAALRWYPDDVWLWLIGCQWRRLSQEEHFVGRTAEVGDDLGSRLLAARLVRDVIRLCFLLERRYAPYVKWLGSAFAQLDAHRAVAASLAAAVAANGYAQREAALADAVEEVARRHNALGLTRDVDPHVRPFHSRPFRVLASERFADACHDAVADPWLRSLPPVGGIDQWVDSTDVLSHPPRARKTRVMYE